MDSFTRNISIEDVAKFPLPGTAVPGNITFSPDDRLISYLYSPEENLVHILYALDPNTQEIQILAESPIENFQEDKVSLAEALQRERQRMVVLGITQYTWASKTNQLLVPFKGDLYVKDSPSASLRKIFASQDSPAQDPQISPDSNWVSYVQNGELYIIPFDGGNPRQLTSGFIETGKTHGLAEYIAQEEMDRSQGYWWSPNSKYIAFQEVDESHIPVYRIVHQGKDQVGEEAQEDHHYPFAGQSNVYFRLGVVSIESGDVTWMNLGDNPDIYLARVQWFPDGTLGIQIENREQTQLDLYRYDPLIGKGTLLFSEMSRVWINLNNHFHPLEKNNIEYPGGFLWALERTGFRHLYLYDYEGNLVRPLTSGEWMVDALVAVDEGRKLFYFTATKDGPTETHLYVASLDGSEPIRLTSKPGIHTIVCDHACEQFIDTFHSLTTPPRVSLHRLKDGELIHLIYNKLDARINQLSISPPEIVSLKNRNGVDLYGAIFKPPISFGSGPFPTLVMVYGGPHAQLVLNSWYLSIAMRAQYLRSQGFLVFVLDNQGSARRGLSFESVIKHQLGHLEVDDQVDGVKWLVEQNLTDPKRVGIFGWSYGGYMVCRCLMLAPEVFSVGVAGAPVTQWDGYDTHYTERYMGTPRDNPEGYLRSSVMYIVDSLQGKLMLIHGLIDENVHFRHTARLINALIQARKPHDLLLFPNERHLPRKLADRVFMEELIRDYFFRNLIDSNSSPEKNVGEL